LANNDNFVLTMLRQAQHDSLFDGNIKKRCHPELVSGSLRTAGHFVVQLCMWDAETGSA
jgi:hypothetical protein